jgi:hypothetical protein
LPKALIAGGSIRAIGHANRHPHVADLWPDVKDNFIFV